MSKTGKLMEQASISGFQNLKVNKMLQTEKPMEQASISGFQNKNLRNVKNWKTNGAGF